jgi:hypothetical protein
VVDLPFISLQLVIRPGTSSGLPLIGSGSTYR